MKSRNAFTLVELMIAIGLLSALLLAFFGMFRTSTGQFQAGSWRHLAQKEAQIFLNHLRFLLEKSNSPYIMESGNQRVAANQPIYLHATFSNNDFVTLSGTGGIMFFSVNTPAQKAPPAGSGMASLLKTTDKPGVWSGVALCYEPSGESHRLLLINSGDITELNTHLASPYDCPLDGNFQRMPSSSRTRFQLDDVEAVRIVKTAIATGPLEITIRLSKNISGRKTSFDETILAKPINDLGIVIGSF